MKQLSSTSLILVFMTFCLFGLPMCGSESPAADAAVEEISADEEAVLTDEYSLEALETIDEANAEAEADKLAKEIEADQ